MLTYPSLAIDLDLTHTLLKGSLLLGSVTSEEVAKMITTVPSPATSCPIVINTEPGLMNLRPGRTLERSCGLVPCHLMRRQLGFNALRLDKDIGGVSWRDIRRT